MGRSVDCSMLTKVATSAAQVRIIPSGGSGSDINSSFGHTLSQAATLVAYAECRTMTLHSFEDHPSNERAKTPIVECNSSL